MKIYLHEKNLTRNFFYAYLHFTRASSDDIHNRARMSTEEPAVFVVAYMPISARRPAMYFLYGPCFCLSVLIGFWTSPDWLVLQQRKVRRWKAPLSDRVVRLPA